MPDNEKLHDTTKEAIDALPEAAEGSEEVIRTEYTLEYSILDEKGNILEAGNAKAEVNDKELSLASQGHIPFNIPFSDVRNIEDNSWLLKLRLKDSTVISLGKLGRKYDSFLKEVNRAYKKVTKKELLMEEKLISGFEGAYFRQTGTEAGFRGEGAIYLQETGLVLALKNGELRRIPYPFIRKINDLEWSFLFEITNGEGYAVERLGRETERFRRELKGVLTGIESSSLEFLKALLPSASPLRLRPYVKKFLDGLSVSKSELASIPDLWSALGKRIAITDMKDSFEYLSSISDAGSMRIGIKRGLRGGAEGEYTWFFAPVTVDGIRTIVMEATSEGTSGRATYLFDVPSGQSDGNTAESIMDELNFCLYMVNFRREPIYLSEEHLKKPSFEHYRQSIERLDGLVRLRKLFIKRILHRSADQWKQDLDNTLRRR